MLAVQIQLIFTKLKDEISDSFPRCCWKLLFVFSFTILAFVLPFAYHKSMTPISACLHYADTLVVSSALMASQWQHRAWQRRSQPPKIFGGAKCLTLGEQHNISLGCRFSKHKMSRYATNLGSWSPGYAYGVWFKV